MNRLDYQYGHVPNPESFRIQASAISQFFDHTNSFYREKLLNEQGFQGNTSSVLGTSLHWAAEQYITHGSISPADKQEMYDYITEQATMLPELVDETEIRTQLTPMWQTLKQYIYDNPISLAEPFIELELMPNLTVGGSIDAIRCIDGSLGYQSISELTGKTVELIDWKTTAAMNPPTSMPKGYEWQLLVYSYVLKQKYNITVSQITNVYITRHNVNRISETTGKPLKDYPSTIGTVSKPVTPESLDFIESIIKVVADSVYTFVTQPNLRYLLAMDWRLRHNTQVLPFKFGVTQHEEI